jgi:SOS-response transcriptional repressor LexA
MTSLILLTQRQQEIYRFIKGKIEDQGCAPTLREIGDAFHIKSPNSVKCHLIALIRKGLISRESNTLPADYPPSYAESVKRLSEQFTHLREENEALQQRVDELKDEARVREGLIADMMDQIRCPDCQRQRKSH